MYKTNPTANQDRSGFGHSVQGLTHKTTELNGHHAYKVPKHKPFLGFVFFAVYNQSFPNIKPTLNSKYGGILDRSKMPQFTKPTPY